MSHLPVGIHDGIDPAQYHLDVLTPEPALSSSGIKKLLSGSPAEFAASNPRLTQWPEWAQKAATKPQDLGTIVHSLVLGKGCEFQAVDPQDLAEPYGIRLKSGPRKGHPYTTWTGAAKEWKEEQEAAGFIILSKEDGARVQAAADSMIALLRFEYGTWPIGDSEMVVIWQRETTFGPIWCRAMIDHLALQFMTVLDPKSTDWPLNDRMIQKKAAADGWHIQQAFYLEGIRAVADAGKYGSTDPSSGQTDIDRRLTFRFPVVEINPPFQSRFVDLPESWMQVAEQRIDRAGNLFAKCLQTNNWPAYHPSVSPDIPEWMLREYEEEELMES